MSEPADLAQAALARRLGDARPIPSSAFVARLRAELLGAGANDVRARIRRRALAGALLLVLGLISAAGAGPLG